MLPTLFSPRASLAVLLASAGLVSAQSCRYAFPTQSYSINSVCTNGLANACDRGGVYSDVTGTTWNVQCGQSMSGITYTTSNSAQNGVSACFRNCARRPSCSAFTYVGTVSSSTTGDGICYYRSGDNAGQYRLNDTSYASGTITRWNPDLVCPTYDGATYQSQDGALFRIYCGNDMPGVGDASIPSNPAFNMTDCMKQCDAINDCSAFVYQYGGDEFTPGSTRPPGMCYFKSGQVAGVRNRDSNLALRLTAPGTRFNGNTPPARAAANPQACYLGDCNGTGVPSTNTATAPTTAPTAGTTTAGTTTAGTATAGTTTGAGTPSSGTTASGPSNTATIPTYSCPAVNGSLITDPSDPSGAQYYVYCYFGFSGGSYASSETTRGFNECFASCSRNNPAAPFGRCNAVQWFGDAATGGGQCQYKTAEQPYTLGSRGDTSLVAMIRREYYTPPPAATQAPAPNPSTTTLPTTTSPTTTSPTTTSPTTTSPTTTSPTTTSPTTTSPSTTSPTTTSPTTTSPTTTSPTTTSPTSIPPAPPSTISTVDQVSSVPTAVTSTTTGTSSDPTAVPTSELSASLTTSSVATETPVGTTSGASSGPIIGSTTNGGSSPSSNPSSPASTSPATTSGGSVSSTTSSTPAISTTSTPVAPGATTCPEANNTLLLGTSNLYQVECGSDIDGGTFGSDTFETGSFDQCAVGCDSRPECTCWSWIPYPSGDAAVCYYKNLEFPAFVASTSARQVAGILASRAPEDTSSSTTPSVTSSLAVPSFTTLSAGETGPSSPPSSAVTPGASSEVPSGGIPSSSSSAIVPSSSSSAVIPAGTTRSASTSSGVVVSSSSVVSPSSGVVSSSSAVSPSSSAGPSAGSSVVSSTGSPSPVSTSSSGISSTSSVVSGSATITPTTSATTPSVSATPAPVCGQTPEDICGNSGTGGDECASPDGTVYNTDCGVAYVGTVIVIGNLTTAANATASFRRAKRQAVSGLTFAQCQSLCNEQTSPACVAVNYIENQCTLFSSVTGYTFVPGAVAAAVAQNPNVPPVTTATTATSTTSSSTITTSSGSSITSTPDEYTTITSNGSTIVVPITYSTTTSTSSSSTTTGSGAVSTVTVCASLSTSTITVFTTQSATVTTCPASAVCTRAA